jgi:hypothetical protein
LQVRKLIADGGKLSRRPLVQVVGRQANPQRRFLPPKLFDLWRELVQQDRELRGPIIGRHCLCLLVDSSELRQLLLHCGQRMLGLRGPLGAREKHRVRGSLVVRTGRPIRQLWLAVSRRWLVGDL